MQGDGALDDAGREIAVRTRRVCGGCGRKAREKRAVADLVAGGDYEASVLRAAIDQAIISVAKRKKSRTRI